MDIDGAAGYDYFCRERAGRVARMENEMTTPQFFVLFAVILISPHLANTPALVLAFIALACAAFVLWEELK